MGQEKQTSSKSATLSKHGQDEYSGDGEAKYPREEGYRVRTATTNLRGQAARGRPYACRLQHPQGVDSASGARASVSPSRITQVLKATAPQSTVLLPLVGPHTTPGTPLQPIVSTRDPLGLSDPPKIPSHWTSNIIGQRLKAKKEYRPATRDWEQA